MTQITFYVLQNSKASTQEALLLFVCRLCRTVLAKSKQTVVVIDDNVDRLEQLNQHLWSFDAIGFMPHDLLIYDTAQQFISSLAPIRLIGDVSWLWATDTQPPFDGVVINLSAKPLPLSSSSPSPSSSSSSDLSKVCQPNRLLEIIADNEIAKEIGRQKYRHYQNQGHALQHHLISS